MRKFLVYAPSANYTSEASFRIRLVKLAEPLLRRGFTLDFHTRPKTPWGRLALARSARGYDGVILHRKMLDPYEARALRRHVAAVGGRIYMDIDDATMLHETELGFLARRRLQRRYQATLRIIQVACAGNAYLGKMFEDRGIRSVLMPSVVDPATYRLKSDGDGTALVWIGSRSTLKYLEESFPALRAAAERVKGLRLVVICDAPPSIPAPVPVEHVPWSQAGEASALLKGDIGIAPTPENPWTLGKCGFKIVQYMAAGLPVVASPVGLNVDLVHPAQGPLTGLLPADWSQWPVAIERLAGDAALRREYGGAGRKRVEQELCIEKMADRWAHLLGA